MTIVTAGFVGFGVTLAACPFVLWAIRHRIVDQPNDRSSHDRVTPRGGGVAIGIGALTAILLMPGLATWRTPLILASAGFAVLGLVDDLRRLPALVRLAVQALVAVATLPLLVHHLTGAAAWRAVFACGVFLWLISYVNAFNFMDGINGIAAAQTLVAGAAWWMIGRTEAVPALATGGLVIAGCAVAFGPFNFPRAHMFLGDVGSYFLGGWLAVLVVVGLRSGLTVEAVVAPVAVALVDTFSTIVRRIRRGERWYEAHREHVYQRLVRGGWSHTVTTSFVALTATLSAAAGAATLALHGPLGRLASDALLAMILVAYLASPALAAGLSARAPTPVR